MVSMGRISGKKGESKFWDIVFHIIFWIALFFILLFGLYYLFNKFNGWV